MADISASNWSETDASNNSAAPDGAPEGMAPSGVNDTMRAMMGGVKRFWDRINGVLTSGGGTTAYTLTPTVALGSYVTGERFTFKANATSTGAATLNISALGAKNIYKMANAAVAATVAGDLVDNMMYEVVYDGTQFILLNPSTAGADVLTTRGDILRRGATIPSRLAIGAANRVLTSDGTDPAWGQVTGPMIAMGSDAQGDILYYNGTSYVRLGAGTSGHFLKTQGAGANPTWAASGVTKFTSTAQTITAAGSLTLAHSLGAAPFAVGARLKCTSTEANYSVNDEVAIELGSQAITSGGTADKGVSVVADTTNLNVRFGAATATFAIPDKTTGANTAITNSKWNIIFYAWV
jgi:hypothetical protein